MRLRPRNHSTPTPSARPTTAASATVAPRTEPKPPSSAVSPATATSPSEPSSDEVSPSTPQRTKKEKLLIAGAAMCAILVLGGLAYWYWQSFWLVTMGRVVVKHTPLIAPYHTHITTVAVREGDQVQQGQVLMRFDEHDAQFEIQKAETALEQHTLKLHALQASGVAPSWHTLEAAAERDYIMAQRQQDRADTALRRLSQERDSAKRYEQRMKELVLLNAAPKIQWEDARQETIAAQTAHLEAQLAVKEAQAAADGAKRILDEHRRGVAMAREASRRDQDYVRYAIAQATAELQAAQQALPRLALRAPADGVMGWIHKRAGDSVNAGETVAVFADPTQLSITAYIKGEDAANVHIGQKGHVRIDDGRSEYYPCTVALYPYRGPEELDARASAPRTKALVDLLSVLHPVKLTFDEPPPQDIRPETIAWVWLELDT